MKKFTSILAVAAVVVALSSCGSKNAESTETPAADTTMTTETPAMDTAAAAMPADTAAAMATDTAAHH